jgi:hypothetical protein
VGERGPGEAPSEVLTGLRTEPTAMADTSPPGLEHADVEELVPGVEPTAAGGINSVAVPPRPTKTGLPSEHATSFDVEISTV